jgi:hypothetical protein
LRLRDLSGRRVLLACHGDFGETTRQVRVEVLGAREG